MNDLFNVSYFENHKMKFAGMEELFDDFNCIPEKEKTFSDNPIYQFQICLENILYLAKLDRRKFAELLKVSLSTSNNIIANESMTNNKPTLLTRSQFIFLLLAIQKHVVEKGKGKTIVLYLFSILLSGLPVESDIKFFENFLHLESAGISESLFYQCAYESGKENSRILFKSIRLFVRWRSSNSNKTMAGYYGASEDSESYEWFDKKEEVETADDIDNYIKKFIPLYIDWYISNIVRKWI